MKSKIKKIISLQQYAKKKRKNRVEFLDYDECNYCEFYRKENNVCLGGNGIMSMHNISYCPITQKSIKQLL